MFKNTAAKFIVFAFDATTNVPKTGDAANITAYVSKDYGAVTVLADTSATEMDATNAPGYYLFDAAQGETNADCLMVSAKSSTSNIKVIGAPAVIYTRPQTGWLAPATAGRTLVVDAAGLADANMVKAGPSGSGTAQTAGDIIGDTNDIQSRLPAALGANGNLKADVRDYGGTAGTFSGGRPDVNTTHAAGTAWNSGAIGAATLASDTITAAKIAADAIGASELAADAVAEIQSGLSTLDAAGVRTAVGLASANLDTQLGTLATGSLLATVASYIDTEVAAIKAKTDNLPAAPAAVGDIPTAVQNADALLGRNIAGGSSSGRLVKEALYALRNKWTSVAGVYSVYGTDDTTLSWSSTLSTDAAAEPLIGSDPA